MIIIRFLLLGFVVLVVILSFVGSACILRLGLLSDRVLGSVFIARLARNLALSWLLLRWLASAASLHQARRIGQ